MVLFLVLKDGVMNKKMKNELLIFVDFESTGLNVEQDEIVEYAFIVKNANNELCRSSGVVNTDVPISKEASEINGISQAEIDNSIITQRNMCELFYSILKMKPVIVAHNLFFDFSLLFNTFVRVFGELTAEKVLFGCDVLDTLTVSRDRTYYPNKLGELVDRYGLNAVNSHKALDDVEALIALYDYMEKERDDLDKYLNLIGYYPKYGLGGSPLNTRKIVYLPQPFHDKKVTIGKTLYSSAKCLISQLRGGK